MNFRTAGSPAYPEHVSGARLNIGWNGVQ